MHRATRTAGVTRGLHFRKHAGAKKRSCAGVRSCSIACLSSSLKACCQKVMAQKQDSAPAASFAPAADAAPEAASNTAPLAFSSAPTCEPDISFSAVPCASGDTGPDAGAGEVAAPIATGSFVPAESAFSQDLSFDLSSPGTPGAALQRDLESAHLAHPGEASETPAAEAAVPEGPAAVAEDMAAAELTQSPGGSPQENADSAVFEAMSATAALAGARTDQGRSVPAAAPSGAATPPGSGAAQLFSSSAASQQAGLSTEARAASAGQQRVLLADAPGERPRRASQSAPAGGGDAAQRSALSGQPRVLFKDLPGERPGAPSPPTDAASRHSSAGQPRVLFADLRGERLSAAGPEAEAKICARVSAREALDAAEEERTLLVAKNGALQHRIRQACPTQGLDT